MRVFLSVKFTRRFKRLKRKDPKIATKVARRLELLEEDPDNPELRLHKLQGRKLSLWSISIEEDLRITFTYVSEGILLVNIGTHDEVY